jgi:peptide-methionine (S)-S-oxide reductase
MNVSKIDARQQRARRLLMAALGAACLLSAGMLLSRGATGLAAERAVVVPPPAADEPAHGSGRAEVAVFAGGCFWGVQGVFQHVRGVSGAVSGYAGGSRDTASYERVGTGDTRHAESVQITYDPAQITYGRLLQIFFSVAHNPTELNRQGPDYGTQYRSAVFALDDLQRRIAQEYIAQLDRAGVFGAPLATRVEAFSGFYPAEEYHQNFLTLHPRHPYIVINDLPKVDELKRLFPDRYEARPVLVQTTSR